MDVVRYTGEEWSALYVDGKLDIVGDSYLIDDRISELFGVTEYQDESFMQGGNDYGDVAPTLDALHAYKNELSQKQESAAELRRQAAELIAQAEALTKE